MEGMLKRPPLKKEETEEEIKELIQQLMTPGPPFASPPPLPKAETWVYSPKAKRLDAMLRHGGRVKDMSDADFGGMDLSRQDLSGMSFRRSFLGHVSFEGSRLEKTDFSDADLRFANFRNADLRGADFKGANLEDADFTGAILTDADFDGDTLVKNAKLPMEKPETLEGLLRTLKQIEDGEFDIKKLPKRYLRYVNLRAMDLTGLDLTGVDLTALDLSGVNLSGVKFDARKASRADELEAEVRRQQLENNTGKGRPVFKRLYDFPALFEEEIKEERKKAKIETQSQSNENVRLQPQRIMPRMRIRRRVKVKT